MSSGLHLGFRRSIILLILPLKEMQTPGVGASLLLSLLMMRQDTEKELNTMSRQPFTFQIFPQYH